MYNKRSLALFLGILVIGLSSCSSSPTKIPADGAFLESLPWTYKQPRRQGNVITSDMVAELKVGMEKEQVLYLLGTPAVTDFFHAQRWDYVYIFNRGQKRIEQRHLVLYFDKNILKRIEGEYREQPKSSLTGAIRPVDTKVPDWEDKRKWWQRVLGIKAKH